MPSPKNLLSLIALDIPELLNSCIAGTGAGGANGAGVNVGWGVTCVDGCEEAV